MIWRYLDPRSMAVTLALTAMLLAAAIQLTSRAIGSRNLGLSFSSRGLAMAALGFMVRSSDWVAPSHGACC